MDKSQQSLPMRGHVRNKSSTTTRPRSSTKGPLDVDEKIMTSPVATLQAQRAAVPPPLSLPQSPQRQAGQRGRSAAPSPGRRSPMPHSPARSVGWSGGGGGGGGGDGGEASSRRPKDFSFLLKPEIYHPLSTANLPAAFRSSPQQPMPETPLAELLAAGQFRAAAIVAAQQLTGTGTGSGSGSGSGSHGGGETQAVDPTDHVRIFGLLYTRLACLVLVDAMPLAAQEGKALEDLGSSFYYDAATGTHLVPWALRVLNVRLQAVGFGDPRRAIMSYYDLAREARARAAAAAAVDAVARHDHSASELWKGRLAELGLKVAGALIEMDDMAGAAAHLTSMAGSGGSGSGGGDGGAIRRIQAARALLWLHIGDVDAARAEMQRFGAPNDDDNDNDNDNDNADTHTHTLAPRIVSALCDMADDNYGAALATWRDLREDAPSDEMIGVNLAVCLLYVGQMQEGRAVLESLVDAGYSSHTLLFNLSTMYELCSDRSKSLKLQLAQRMADRAPSTAGWERVNADFKL